MYRPFQRPGTTCRSLKSQLLESRLCLAADIAPTLVDGWAGYNEATKAWEWTLADGPAGGVAGAEFDWQPPLAADTNGDGVDELWMHDRHSGQWWRVDRLADGTTVETLKGIWSPSGDLRGVGAADISGNGREELIGWNPDSGKWMALINNGEQYNNLTLSSWSPGSQWHEPLLGDSDGDGVAEIFIQSAYGVWWRMAKSGDSYLTNKVARWDAAAVVESTTLADVDGDGVRELVGKAGSRWFVSWLGGETLEFDLGQARGNAVVADFNGDQIAEIVAHDAISGYWQAYQIVDGQLISQIVGHWNPQSQFTDVAAADVSGDGVADIIGRTERASWWSLSSDPAQPGNTFLRGWTLNTGWRSIQLADVDGDGRTDILANHDSNDSWIVIRHNGASYVSELFPLWNPAGGSFSVGATTARLSDSPAESLVAWNAFQGVLIEHSYAGQQAATNPLGYKPYRPEIDRHFALDIDGDGRAKPVGWNEATESLWRLAAGGGKQHDDFLLHLPGGRDGHWFTADADADGDRELVVLGSRSGVWQAADFSSGGAPIRRVLARWEPAESYEQALLVDFDGDSMLDLMARDQNGTVHAARGADGFAHEAVFAGWESLELDHFFAADFDGNGREEVVARNGQTGAWNWLNWEAAELTSRIVGNWSTSIEWQHVHVADLNGDGSAELVGQQVTGGWWATSYQGDWIGNRKIGFWEPGVVYAYAGTADLDGDGAAEVVGLAAPYHRALLLNATAEPARLLTLNDSVGDAIADQVGMTFDRDGDGRDELLAQTQTDAWRSYTLHEGQLVEQAAPALSATWSNVQQVDLADTSNGVLRDGLLAHVDGLAEALAAGDREAAARLLLAWSAESTNFALSSAISKLSSTQALGSEVGETYFRRLATLRDAFYCGATARFFSDVLALFDIPAVVLDFGDLRNGLTHSTVIVPLEHEGEVSYAVFDPTFHVEFRLEGDQSPADLLDMLDAAADGRAGDISVVQGSLEERAWIIERGLPAPEAMTLVFEQSVGDRDVYRRPGYGLHTYLTDAEANLIALGYPLGVPGLMALVAQRAFVVESNGIGDHADTLAAELAARGVQLGLP